MTIKIISAKLKTTAPWQNGIGDINPDQTTHTSEPIYIEVEVTENSWDGIMHSFLSWENVKNRGVSWSNIKNW